MPRKQEDVTGDVPESTRTPRFAAAWAALVYALSALTLTYPALAGQFLVNPLSDQYKAGYSFRDFAAQARHCTGLRHRSFALRHDRRAHQTEEPRVLI